MMPSTTAFKRCRPLLGTFVEISLLEDSNEVCFAAGFESIVQTSGLMSFHDSSSELSLLNKTPVGQWATLSQSVIQILALSLELQHKSRGQFNVAAARPIDFKYLAQPGFEIKNFKARRVLPIQIDLGGIAKGFAVDTAVNEIQALNQNVSGYVNAGGDLRVFGSIEQPVLVQTGTAYNRELKSIHLCNQSIATSTISVNEGQSPYVDIKNQHILKKSKTAVARAKSCVLADAFTKIALLMPYAKAEKLAAEYQVDVSLVS
jgi:thiamine biosynthesis lipoprotein